MQDFNRGRRIGVAWALAFGLMAGLDVQGQDDLMPELSGQTITLERAIETALSNSLELKIERLRPEVEADKIGIAESVFDPEIRVSALYESIDRPQNTREFVATGGNDTTVNADGSTTTVPLEVPRIFEERNARFNAAVVKRLRLGTEIELGTRFEQLDNTLNRNRPPSLYSPEYFSFTGVTIRQPLLQGGGAKVNTAELKVALINKKIADLDWVATISTAIASVAKSYYDLAAAYETLVIRREAISFADKLLGETKKRLDLGVAVPLEVRQAEVAKSVREEEALLAQAQFVEAQNALKLLVQAEANVENPNRYIPGDGLASFAPRPERVGMMNSALANRPDYMKAKRTIERENIRLSFAKNQLWPRLNLQASFGLNGLDDSYGNSLNRAFDPQGEQWSIGISFSVPLGNRRAKSGLAVAKKEMQQAIINLKRAEMVIALEIDTALNRLSTNRKRVLTAANSRRLAEEALGIEMKLLSSGRSESRSVIEIERQVSESQAREISAKVDLNKATVDLHLVSGALLEEHGVLIEGMHEVPAGSQMVDELLPEDMKRDIPDVTPVKVEYLKAAEDGIVPVQKAEFVEAEKPRPKPVVLSMELVAKSELPEERFRKNRAVFGVYEYKVVEIFEGDYKHDTIRVLHLLVRNGKKTSLARRGIGRKVSIDVVPNDECPKVADMEIIDSLPENGELKLYLPNPF